MEELFIVVQLLIEKMKNLICWINFMDRKGKLFMLTTKIRLNWTSIQRPFLMHYYSYHVISSNFLPPLFSFSHNTISIKHLGNKDSLQHRDHQHNKDLHNLIPHVHLRGVQHLFCKSLLNDVVSLGDTEKRLRGYKINGYLDLSGDGADFLLLGEDVVGVEEGFGGVEHLADGEGDQFLDAAV